MIINQMSVTNLGLFRGKHIFNFKPEKAGNQIKPIILIGGKNGAGKTTIFEAFRLCLYGPHIHEKKLSKNKYEKYLIDKIHEPLDSEKKLPEASIEIEFNFSHLGKVDTYNVLRSWHRSKDSVKEFFSIKKNNHTLDDLEEDQWQDFLNELIPFGISKLFFFDGEKIQNLAENEDDENHLNESFKSLLGLNLVERLHADLGIFATRHLKKIGISEVEKKRKELEKEKNELEELLEIKIQKRAQIQTHHEQTKGKIEEYENKITASGGSFANKRAILKERKVKIETELDQIENQIRDVCHNLFPFAITPKYCHQLKTNLKEEADYQNWQITQKTVDSTVDTINLKISTSELWEDIDVDYNIQKEIIQKISTLVKESATPESIYKDFKPIHNLSNQEVDKITSWINEALDKTPNQLAKSTQKIEKLTRQLQKVEQNIARAPEDDVINPLIKKLNESNIELGHYQEQIKLKDEEVRKLEYSITECERNINKQIERIKDHTEISDKITLCGNIRESLNEYTLTLRKERIKEFCRVFIDCFNILSRKESPLSKVKVDENNFTLTLYGKSGEVFPKKRLSAGEKQIYAISMIWTLTKISRRPLPFIIDTPLGRLDSDHRNTLVKKFFPYASHQILIFSTDTEVDKKYFEDLNPFIARNYHLEYSSNKGMTTFSESYFWNNEEEEELLN